jgi:hypothetical protein
LNEGYFSTETPAEAKEQPLKRGRDSQKKTKVLIIAESEMVENPQQGKKLRRVGYLKMKVIEDLQKSTINEQVKNLTADTKEINTEGKSSILFTTSNLSSCRNILTSFATNLTDHTSERRFSAACSWLA